MIEIFTMDTSLPSSATGMGASPISAGASDPSQSPAPPQMMLLDFFFPGFSVFSAAVQKSLHIDLTIYIPLVLLLGGITFAWRYFSEQIWDLTESHLMSVVDIRTDDEIYNMLMAWVATQRFSQGARRFVVNTNLNSRSWFLWRYDYDDDEDDTDDTIDGLGSTVSKKDKKALAYTPTFGSHWFWYKGRLLIFSRSQNREQSSYMTVSEREEISISCFGRNPWVLKELLHEARQSYLKRDEAKTLIYRSATAQNRPGPAWQRCIARTSRPFSTVILNKKVKKDLIDDVTDYLNPATRRWYSNRGIPYRRGYLLYGPPGTGKSSLSLALAGFFKMRIYIVSLSSPTANEENLASLFAELPRRCVVLLEDIDTAGLTHTREGDKPNNPNGNQTNGDMVPGQKTPGDNNNTTGRLSLSGLLNILDGVASQEGRVLIMTTNHVDKLDKALIRPGRVDMIVKFDRADHGMTAEIFKAIFAPLEGDDTPPSPTIVNGKLLVLDAKAEKELAEKKAEAAKQKEETVERISKLAEKFAAKIPEREFSPAEIQGYLLKNKRDPDGAVEGAEQWIVDARKEKKEKESKDAEEKQKQEEENKKKEAEEKKKKDEEEKKEKKKNKTKKSKRQEVSDSDSDSSSSSESESDSESDSEAERKKKKKKAKAKAKKASKKISKAAKNTDEEAKVEAKEQEQLDTPPLTPKKDSFEVFPQLLFVKGGDVPAIKVEAAPAGRDAKVAGEGNDSGYGTPTASVKGDDELDAVVVSALPAIKV